MQEAAQHSVHRVPSSEKSSLAYYLCCFFGLTIVLLGSWLLNTFIFPYYDTLLAWTREISTLGTAITLIVVALFATWKPWVFSERFFVIAIVLCLISGIAGTWIGLSLSSIPILVIGASLAAIGRGVLSVMVGIACIKLPFKQAGICVSGACFAVHVLRWLLLMAPPFLAIALFFVGPFIALALVARYAKPVFDQMRDHESPAQVALTQPSSFLPFGHQLFISLLLFRIAYGYALTLGEVDGVPPVTTLALVPLALVAVFAIFSKKDLNPDTLFQVSFLFVIAGFLLAAVPFEGKGSVVNTLLMSGVGCFEILIWFILISLGSRNSTGALSVFSWGLSINSIGVVIGANFGRFTNGYYGVDSPMVSLIAVTLTFLFVAYVVVAMRKFSFKETIAAVLPEHETIAPVEAETSRLDARTDAISAQYGLTARESEVFKLLARGRNGRFIQDELVVSYNTVKAHVKHIYAKLGIHTQQELIDLVEQDGNQEQPSLHTSS